MNKIDLSDNGNVLFTSGLGGTARYEKQGESFALAARKDAPRMVQIKASKAGNQNLIAQEASDNHVIVLDKLLVPAGRAENGTKEDGDGNIYLPQSNKSSNISDTRSTTTICYGGQADQTS